MAASQAQETGFQSTQSWKMKKLQIHKCVTVLWILLVVVVYNYSQKMFLRIFLINYLYRYIYKK